MLSQQKQDKRVLEYFKIPNVQVNTIEKSRIVSVQNRHIITSLRMFLSINNRDTNVHKYVQS